jgi:hypothetical protein
MESTAALTAGMEARVNTLWVRSLEFPITLWTISTLRLRLVDRFWSRSKLFKPDVFPKVRFRGAKLPLFLFQKLNIIPHLTGFGS